MRLVTDCSQCPQGLALLAGHASDHLSPATPHPLQQYLHAGCLAAIAPTASTSDRPCSWPPLCPALRSRVMQSGCQCRRSGLPQSGTGLVTHTRSVCAGPRHPSTSVSATAVVTGLHWPRGHRPWSRRGLPTIKSSNCPARVIAFTTGDFSSKSLMPRAPPTPVVCSSDRQRRRSLGTPQSLTIRAVIPEDHTPLGGRSH